MVKAQRKLKRRTKRRMTSKKKFKLKRTLSNKKHKKRTIWLQHAYNAGREVAANLPLLNHVDAKKELNKHWHAWRSMASKTIDDWSYYVQLSSRYVKGFSDGAGWGELGWLLAPSAKDMAAIITVMNEENTIAAVIQQLNRLPLHELIVVVNGSTDHSFYKVRQHSEATIIHYADPLGYDIGRAIGARAARSEILLFLDGDFPILAEHLLPFIYSIEQGYDMALNDISPYIQHFYKRDAVTICKDFLNRILRRGDLRANSLTAIPHALSQRAVEAIGFADLAVPPKAQAKAVQLGLAICAPSSVDVVSVNRQREQLNIGMRSPVANLIIGDHLEALAALMNERGARVNYDDHIRNRAFVGGNQL